ncbi:putative intracellular protease/amidase [Herbihabitans rhizosphaerae]|uniref:Putative intracellular protease/amidase n=1 Tax=Herbihabitans rhizosphaerae TaxID=1872711 RepID=A0A4Q7KIU0_9PSEU|nr:DJ-1/PfpI family protein [Herbihabitans rhizosphaerae]RZS36478.1 putative intracellular protease/amidase [Herbihabitans rhizosphaerae]
MMKTVHLAVYDTLSDWETGYAVASVNQPMWQREPGRYRVLTVGPSTDPITTAGGARIVPDVAIADLSPADSAMLIMPGANTFTPSGDHALAPFAQVAGEFLDAGTPVAAICGGTMGLASAGLLNDRAHTSNAREYLAMAPAYTGTEHYRDEPAVRDRGLITAAAIHPAEFAREIFAELDLYTPEVADAWYRFYGKHEGAAYFDLEKAAAS